MKLLWLPENWPESLEGFRIQRRAVVDDRVGEWIPLGPEVIRPAIDTDRDFSETGLPAEEARQLGGWLRGRVDRGELHAASSDEMVDVFRGDPLALGLWRMAWSRSYQLALSTGVAWVDRAIPALAGGRYEYGLFSVARGSVSSTPVASFSWLFGTTDDLALDVELTARKVQQGLALTWQYSPEDYRARQLAGFEVFRETPDGESRLLVESLIPGHAEAPGANAFVDKSADADRATAYGVVPVNYFGRQGPRVRYLYEPDVGRGAVARPDLRSVEALEGGGLRFAWEFDVAHEDQIRGFAVERRVAEPRAGSSSSDVLTSVALNPEILDPGIRQFEDRGTLLETGWHRFQVVAVDLAGDRIAGPALAVYFDPRDLPPPPEDFAAEILSQDGDVYIRLTWRESPLADRQPLGYALYANSPPDDRLWKQADLGVLRAHEHLFRVYTADAAIYRFQLTTVDDRYQESDPSETLEVPVGATVLPVISLREVRRVGQQAELTWQYSDHPSLRGFRIYQDDLLVADVDTLGLGVRQWTSEPLEPERNYRFVLEAVSTSGATTRAFPQSFGG